MHKDKLKVFIDCEGESEDDVLSDFAGSINGVNQWRVERTGGGESDYEVTVWKGSGLDHVSVDGKFEDFVESDERVLSGSIVDYWQNI